MSYLRTGLDIFKVQVHSQFRWLVIKDLLGELLILSKLVDIDAVLLPVQGIVRASSVKK